MPCLWVGAARHRRPLNEMISELFLLYCFNFEPFWPPWSRCYVDETPFNTTLPSTFSVPAPFVEPGSAFVTPLAALANEDMAAADKGAIPSIAGGG
jgi:hypothetical protein